MKLSFLFYEPIEHLGELDRRMETLAGLGYKGIEITASHPFPFALDEVKDLSEKYGLQVVSFLSGWSYGHERICLSSRSEEVRARAVRRLIECGTMAAPFQAIVVVGLLQGLLADESDVNRAKGRIVESLKTVARTSQKTANKYVLEPVNHLQVGFTHTAAEAEELVDQVDSPALGYMLDTIHMHIEERSVIETVRTHGSRIRHFHLCETNGGLFGTGSLDFRGILETLCEQGYSKWVSVKIYRTPDWEENARSAIKYLNSLSQCFFTEGRAIERQA